MSLYDVIAAGQNGQCFALLARRYMISEHQVAGVVRRVMDLVLPALDAWVTAPGGLVEFLETMSCGGYRRVLKVPGALNNHVEIDRGLALLRRLRQAREIDAQSLQEIAEATGVTQRILEQMLPVVCLLMMAALHVRSEKQMRDILGGRLGPHLTQSPDPYADLAELVTWEAKGHRAGTLAGMIASLFGRRPEMAKGAVPA